MLQQLLWYKIEADIITDKNYLRYFDVFALFLNEGHEERLDMLPALG
jgi:hypothetical protein